MCKKKCKEWREKTVLMEMRLEECVLDCALIGKRVRSARKEKKVTQEELSEHCGCTPTHICNLENGKIGVSLDLLFRISIYLGKSMDYFVMGNENANPQIKIENNIAPKLKQCDTQICFTIIILYIWQSILKMAAAA